MSITATEIAEVVSRADDFAHEMRVGGCMRKLSPGLTLHGGTYVDAVTGKVRQFDYRWSNFNDEFGVCLAVECKNVSEETPVVISGVPRSRREAFHHLMESRKGGAFATTGAANHDANCYIDSPAASVARAVKDDGSIYRRDEFVGKAVLQLKPASGQTRNSYVVGRDSEIYDRWSQAISSAVALVEASRRFVARFAVKHVFTLTLPVVVLPNSTLWQIEYDDAGAVLGEPRQVDECEFYIGREVILQPDAGDSDGSYWLSHLHFATLRGFEEMLSRITSDSVWRSQVFHSDAIVAALAERRS